MKRLWDNAFFEKKMMEILGDVVDVTIPPAQTNGPAAVMTLGSYGVVGLWTGGDEVQKSVFRLPLSLIDGVSGFMYEHDVDPKWGWWLFGDIDDPVIISHKRLHQWRMKSPFDYVDIVGGSTRKIFDITPEEMKVMMSTMGWPCRYLNDVYILSQEFEPSATLEEKWSMLNWDDF